MTYAAYSHPAALFHARSPHWPAVERAHRRAEPVCRGCGAWEGLAVHHVLPFHVRPDLELDPANLVTVCMDHHLHVGHRGNWHDWDPDCVRKLDVLRGARK